jgi:hypothetical protein
VVAHRQVAFALALLYVVDPKECRTPLLAHQLAI